MPKLQSQIYSDLQKCLYGTACQQNQIYEMPELPSKIVAEEGHKQGINQAGFILQQNQETEFFHSLSPFVFQSWQTPSESACLLPFLAHFHQYSQAFLR